MNISFDSWDGVASRCLLVFVFFLWSYEINIIWSVTVACYDYHNTSTHTHTYIHVLTHMSKCVNNDCSHFSSSLRFARTSQVDTFISLCIGKSLWGYFRGYTVILEYLRIYMRILICVKYGINVWIAFLFVDLLSSVLTKGISVSKKVMEWQ